MIRGATELARADYAQLMVVHVQTADGLPGRRSEDLDRHRGLTAELGDLHGDRRANPAEALAGAARARGDRSSR